PPPLPPDSHWVYARHVARLPAETRAALVTLAAASESDLAGLLPGALADMDALAPAELAGMVRVESGRTRVVDPLIRSAAYYRVPSAARAAAHRRLADAMAPMPHRASWHAALAGLLPDGLLAEQLEATSEVALHRDGYVAAAVMMQRSAVLTGETGDRIRRLVRAAGLARRAGDLAWASSLSRCALTGADSRVHRIQAQTELGAALCWAVDQRLALETLLDAATAAAEIAPRLAWEPLRVAATTAFMIGDAADSCGVARVLRTLEDLGAPAQGADVVESEEIRASQLWTQVAIDPLRAHLIAPAVAGVATGSDNPMTLTAAGGAAWLAGELDVAVRYLRRARATDTASLSLRNTAMPLMALSWACLDSGRWDEAVRVADEMAAVGHSVAQPLISAIASLVRAGVAVRRGETSVARDHVAAAAAAVDGRDSSVVAAWMHHTLGLIELADNDSTAAYAELSALFTESGAPLHAHVSYLALADYAEAAVLSGWAEEARLRLPSILGYLPAQPAPRTAQLVAHARAILDPERAGGIYAEALADPVGERWPFERARLRVGYAGLLRRERRRKHAQRELATALSVLEGLGARLWIEVCGRELRAAGVRAHSSPDSPPTTAGLSPQEHHVVYLVAQGYTNPQIAAMLHLSARTVSGHLYRSFPKLGVTSRHQIHDIEPPPAVRLVGG
ncbi:MAG TPA: LuxR C-terminal-related transcriptional regulator, partial [Mycobacterium sp.]|nr:LuxR C-terminal-related transcriptional regulator [Mycobacterium sp.]